MQSSINRKRESLRLQQVRSMTWLPKKTTRIKTRNGLQKVISCYGTTSLITSIFFDRIENECTRVALFTRAIRHKTEINDTTSLEQSPRKILFAYDCESMPLYENQEGCIRDYAEREAYWDIPTAMSPESFVRGAVSTPEQSTSYSDALVSSSAETIDLVTPNLIQGTPPNAACYAPKKRKLQ